MLTNKPMPIQQNRAKMIMIAAQVRRVFVGGSATWLGLGVAKPETKPQIRIATLIRISTTIPHLNILLSFIIFKIYYLRSVNYFLLLYLVSTSMRQMEESSMSMVMDSIFARM